MSIEVRFEAVGRDTDPDAGRSCRRLIVGQEVNAPEPYEGYGGFLGWAGVSRLRSGRWVLAFSSGYWHASPRLTDETLEDEACRKQFEEWHEIGMPEIHAPRGGRAHIMFSDDEGLTWSRPELLVDTEDDDRHPTILEIDDGTLLCTFFTYRLPRAACVKYMISRDGGQTWSDPANLTDEHSSTAFSNGPAIQLADGAVVWVVEGLFDPTLGHTCIGTFRSLDRARTFRLASLVRTDHELCEPTVVETTPGRLVMAIRREGDMCFSDDGGVTWEVSGSTGWNLFDPHLLQTPNGVLALFHGSYTMGGVRVFLSPDGGRTWRGPARSDDTPYGYCVDQSVYGYCHPMLLPDGTVYLVYQDNGGHRPEDVRREALWGLRVRVNDDADGVEILPAP